MPRRNRDPLAGDAARAARHRLKSRLGVTDLPDTAGFGEKAGPRESGLPAGAREGALLPELGRGGSALQESDAVSAGLSPRVRWRVPWRVPFMLLVPALLLAVWFGWQAWAGRPPAEQLGAAGGTSGDVSSQAPVSEGADSEDPAGARIVVHVAGAVEKPGIVSLPSGSRVFEAISAAGGADAAASLDGLNLAAVVQDGAKIQVPRQGEVPEPPQGGAGGAGTARSGSGTAAGARININTASAAELDALPKVGPVLAGRIVAWREEHGPFAAVEELDAVDGVGPKMLEALLPLVTV